jgi:ABC-type polysaccharide/polyol phosphate transport system ATPase subunit
VKALEPGRIQAVDLGRRFRISTGGGRSLKATLLRREVTSVRDFWALRHVDVEIEPGETFGIVGRNGSGKSTFLKMLARIYGPSEGHCAVGGRMSSLIELGAGFHPEFNAVENIFLAGSVYGIPKRELERDLNSIIEFAELEKFAYQPIKTYSSGMFMRLGFSVAMHVHPDVLLLDEIFAVGDESFVQKCLGRVAEFRRNGGTMLLVSHDPDTVKRLCQRAMLLERGTVVTVGSSEAVINRYHERLSTQEDESDRASGETHRGSGFEVNVSIRNAAGEKHHQFLEGEKILIRAEVRSKNAYSDVRVGIGIRDDLGRALGDRSVQGCSIDESRQRVAVLELTDHPLRNGLFSVDIGIQDVFTGQTVLHKTGVASFSMYGQAVESYGPIQLGGLMRLE